MKKIVFVLVSVVILFSQVTTVKAQCTELSPFSSGGFLYRVELSGNNPEIEFMVLDTDNNNPDNEPTRARTGFENGNLERKGN